MSKLCANDICEESVFGAYDFNQQKKYNYVQIVHVKNDLYNAI